MAKKTDYSEDSSSELRAYAASWGALSRELAPTDEQDARSYAIEARGEVQDELNSRGRR